MEDWYWVMPAWANTTASCGNLQLFKHTRRRRERANSQWANQCNQKQWCEHWETPSHTLTALQRNSLTVWHMYFLFHSAWLSSYVSRQWVHVLWVFPALLLHINTTLIHHAHSGSQVKEEPLKAIVCAVNWCKIIRGDLCKYHGVYHLIIELLGL